MLSRIVFTSKNLLMTSRPLLVSQMVRSMASEIKINAPPLPQLVDSGTAGAFTYDPKKESLEDYLNIRFGPEMPTINDDKRPERDVKNFPRIGQPIMPDRTRLYVFPNSWFEYFYDKTGVTGPYVFFGAFGTFLFSKEWYVIDHESITGLCLAILTAGICIKFGPQIRTWYSTLQDEEVSEWDNWQKGMVEYLKTMVSTENESQEMAKQQKILFDAKRENVKLQLEAEFRRRQMVAYNEVRNRLEYLLAKQTAQRQYEQKHMVNWIIDNVIKSFSPQQEKDVLQKCLVDLKELSTKHKISLT